MVIYAFIILFICLWTVGYILLNLISFLIIATLDDVLYEHFLIDFKTVYYFCPSHYLMEVVF